MKRTFLSMLLVAVLCLSLAIGVSAATEANVYDYADLLSNAEEVQLSGKLADISGMYDAQIVVMTAPAAEGRIDTYIEEVYDGMDVGYGENRDGVLLLICMASREYHILSNGFAGVAIDNGDISDIGDVIVSDLSDGNYAAAFDSFADECAHYLDGYLNGFPFNAFKQLMIALAVGVAVGLIVAFILKGQLKTVRKQDQANVYVRKGSMKITSQSDIYLYRTVNRTKKESSNSSSGGSSRSSGGGSF